MRLVRPLLALSTIVALAGCGSPETKPAPRPQPETTPTTNPPVEAAPTTKDVTLAIKNDTSEPRVVWVETYHPEKGRMSGAPDNTVSLGTLAAGESVTKTFPVALQGWYRVIGARPQEGEKDKVLFMGSFSRLKDSGDEAPVSVNR